MSVSVRGYVFCVLLGHMVKRTASEGVDASSNHVRVGRLEISLSVQDQRKVPPNPVFRVPIWGSGFSTLNLVGVEG